MIETLFYFCYYAYLLGNLKKAEMYYSLLREEFKSNGRKDSLGSHQYIKLKEVKDALNSGNISKKKWISDDVKVPQINSEVTIKQTELVKKLHIEGLSQFKNILDDNVSLYNIEHPCGSYGAVDMVYEGKDTIYPVEVKRGKGEHDLIGQIGKYDLYHRLRLHLKNYRYVQPVTICNSYQKYTLHELKQMKVFTLLYTFIDKKISIRAI